jgi:hypothetical protein
MNAAREKVRVANALGDLPKISASFEKGELSYSKVRAMTRVAMPDNEDFLLNIAHHGTAHHMESLVSKYSRVKRLHENKAADEQYQDRSLKYYYDDDGSFVIKGRFPAEQGALILKALQLAVEQRNAPVARDNADVTAETPDIDVTAETPGLDVTAERREPVSARRADALAEMAESYLASGLSSSSSADRYQVMLHVSAATLKDGITKDNITAETSNPMDEQISHIEDGPHVSAETSRRICCDTGVSPIMTNNDGEPLSIGRKSWTRSACCFQIRVHRHLSH